MLHWRTENWQANIMKKPVSAFNMKTVWKKLKRNL